MPIIDDPLIAACKSKIDEEFGPIPAGLDASSVDAYRMKLARCIAKAAQYVRDNAQVNPGQTVAPGSFEDSSTHAPVVGEGVVDSPGTLS